VAEVVEGLASREGSVVILCGSGNNGGDGLVVARLLSACAFQVSCVVVNADRYSPECIEQLARYPSVSVRGVPSTALSSIAGEPHSISDEELTLLLSKAGVVVDALLGTGQRAAPRGDVALLVNKLQEERSRRSSLRVVAIDIPTGVSGDTGEVFEPHVDAHVTVSIELLKRGVMQFPARAACGDIVTTPIGIVQEGADTTQIEFRAVEGCFVPRLPRRKPDLHKGDLGRVLVIGGCAQMPGAPVLAALGALRSGAGVVSLVTRGAWHGPCVPAECMHVVMQGAEPFFTEADRAVVFPACERADVVVLGPGMGVAPSVAEFLTGLIAYLCSLKRRTVIDADALTLVAQIGLDLRGLPCVITPHPGEATRMLGVLPRTVQSDRFAAVRALWERYGVVSLLKGAGTLVYGEGRGRVITRGTPYLATAGSGDVLSGVIAACFHRSNDALDAAALGAYIHARAGELASREGGGPILASEIARAVSCVVGELER
jgi:NAD(P)H-hydrate epimerase